MTEKPKRHSLSEHLADISRWWSVQTVDPSYGYSHGFTNAQLGRPTPEEQSRFWFTAYERWLNDRPLLTEEDVVARD